MDCKRSSCVSLCFIDSKVAQCGVQPVRPLDSSETPIMALWPFPQTYMKLFCFLSLHTNNPHSISLRLQRTMMPPKHFLHQSTYTQTSYVFFYSHIPDIVTWLIFFWMISRNSLSAPFFSEGEINKNFSSFTTKVVSIGHSL